MYFIHLLFNGHLFFMIAGKKTTFPLIACCCFLSISVAAQKDNIPSSTVEATVDITKTSPRIEDLMYGHFIENLGNWFEGGIWAEMIGDRKFFYPVNNSD